MRNFCYLFFIIIFITSCNKNFETNNSYKGFSADKIYTQAQDNFSKKNYREAIKGFEALETQYPFSKYAQKSHLKLVDAYFKNDEYAATSASAERFIHLYPRSDRVDYAYYMKGMANFKQPRGVFSMWFPLDEASRSPGTQSMAYSDFLSLTQRFPRSIYYKDSLQHLIYLRNMFARRQLNAANYFYNRQLYVAAIGRAQNVIKNYPQAPAAKNALKILRDANEKLHLNNAAREANQVYNKTYT